MTWIVKGTGGYEYACHPDGEVFAPELSEAYRFTTKARATRIAKRLNSVMVDGIPYRVVRLTRPRDRLREAAQAVWDAARPVPNASSFHRVPTHLMRELDWALSAISATPDGGADGGT